MSRQDAWPAIAHETRHRCHQPLAVSCTSNVCGWSAANKCHTCLWRQMRLIHRGAAAAFCRFA
eukprot:6157681-Pleurochrysis_carterae.AAC.2